MMGTWTGTITPAGAAEALDGGLIVIARDAAGLIATAGPNERALFPSKRLAPTEHGLRFEVTLDGVDTRLLVYDLAIADGAMTGTVTFVRHGLTQPAQLSFTRQ